MTGTVDGDEFSIEYQQEFRRTEEDGDEFCTLDLELVGERV